MNRWLQKKMAVGLVGLGLFGSCGAMILADDHKVSVPKETKFVLHLDVDAFRHTELGEMLFKMVQEKAREAIAESGDKAPDLEKIEEMLGFDPFEELRGITIASSDYENPEKSMMAVVEIGKNAGNIEGLVLGLPGYESEEYRKHQIHSASPDEGKKVYGAIHGGASENISIVLSTSKSSVTELLDYMDGKGSKSDSFREITMGGEGKTLLSLEVLELPKEVGEGPQANIAKIVDGLSLQVSESDGDFGIGMLLTTSNEKQAEQLRQMAQGLIAMVDFAQSMDPDDDDLKKFQELAHDLKATRDSNSVKVGLSLAAEKVKSILQEAMDD